MIKEKKIEKNQGKKNKININIVLVVQQKNTKKNPKKKNIKVNLHRNHYLLKVQLHLINNRTLKIELRMQVFIY